jgi:hypothetical protein
MAVTAPGSPYVESSDLVANYPGVSESLAERVDLVGVLPFADSTARGTALPSPTDGQYSYLQDTNATEYYNGTAWVAAGVTPGLTHINTTTVSSQSTVNFNNVFTSDYAVYQIYAVITTSGNDTTFNTRLRSAGTDATGSDYRFQYVVGQNSPSASSTVSSGFLHIGIDNDYPNVREITFINPQAAAVTGYTEIAYTGYATGQGSTARGIHNVSTAYDGFTLIGGAAFSGTVYVYGMRAAA